jgi:cellulose synthase/poly-beta-1,6-N-acetylglucosamine synthase-like glycosyltransferase
MIIVGLLFAYGVNFFYLTYIAWRDRGFRHARRLPDHTPLAEWPRLTVQLPIYNELYVAERLIQAAAKLDYPNQLLEIQVLDDSTDETTAIIHKQVEELRQRGLNILHLHRTNREGFKAGALAEGLARAQGEFLAIFDADFLPPPDFLRRTLPFFQDPGIGFIQTRWGHVNHDYSLLTHLQSLAIDAHFMVEQYARFRAGHWFNFNGTAGVWRRQTMIEAGGWTSDTLTEDLDISYRAFLKGWRALYLRDVEVPAELPVSFSAYRQQQHRWARGSLECAKKYLPTIWRSASIPLANKIEATLHLLGYGVHLLMSALVILYPVVLLLQQRQSNLISLLKLTFIFSATAFAPTIFFIVAQHQLGKRWWQKLPAILFISAFGSGMMVNTLRAAFQAAGSKKGTFERTPKFGIVHKRQDWMRHRYQLNLDPIIFFELGFALLTAITCGFAIAMNNWAIAFYAAIFTLGLCFTSGLTIAQSIKIAWRRGRVMHIRRSRSIENR